MLQDLAPRFAEIALQMIASAYAGVADLRVAESCLLTRRKTQIVTFIERNLHDPQLTPTSVAEAHRITPAYLHRIFSNGGESVGRYILRRRLEECHRALADRMQSSRSITEVALDHGFNNVAHFCRAFRHCYGMTPRELRNTSAGPHQPV
jgi:AraC-like DNA-binding protein